MDRPVEENGQASGTEWTGQWNRIESREIDPHKYSLLIFDNRAKAIL